MPGVAILGSMGSGHDGFVPRASIEGEPLFTVNGIPVMVNGNMFPPHVRPNSTPHAGLAIGTSKFTINKKPIVMIGDPISCGSVIVTGQELFQVV